MAETAAGIMLDTLNAWGIDVIFGLPGDGINGIMEGLRKRQDRIRFIQVRHEEAAAFMACGYARYSRGLGACLATSGPGGIHLVSGLYNAKVAHLPVVALTGHHYHDVIGTHTQQDVDLTKLFTDVAIYSERIMGPAHAENVAHVACRSALGWRGVAHINFPTDLQEQKTDSRSTENIPHHQSVALSLRATRPSEQALRRAAEVLNAGHRAALLCGEEVGAWREELLRLAERLAAPIFAESLGHSPVPEESPYFAGCIGLLGAPAARQALMQCDTLFLIGAALPYSDEPMADGMRIIELTTANQICSADAIEVSLSGEIADALQALLPMVHRKTEQAFLHQVRKGYENFLAGSDQSLSSEAGKGRRIPLHVLSAELSRRVSKEGILVSDLGATDLGSRQECDDLQAAFEVNPSSLPYALAAQVAFPHRQCVAVVRESSFAMLMAEFATAVKYDLPVRVVLIRESPFAGEQADFARFAKACGGSGFTVQSASECGPILEQAFKEAGPVLIAA